MGQYPYNTNTRQSTDRVPTIAMNKDTLTGTVPVWINRLGSLVHNLDGCQVSRTFAAQFDCRNIYRRIDLKKLLILAFLHFNNGQ